MRITGVTGPNRPWRGVDMLVLAIASGFVIILAKQVIDRILFPWDYLVASESAFLTNMWKLSVGEGIYSAPVQANSFVYSPGLEYLSYALLDPFGVALDIRFCRVIVVLLGLGAAFLAARYAHRVLSLYVEGAPQARVTFAVTFVTFTLLIFKGFTSDVCHPDNLHLVYLAMGLCLGLFAIERGSYVAAVATVAILGLGMLLKQSAAFGVVGAVAFFVVDYRRSWGRAKTALLIVVGVASLGLAIGILWGLHPYAKFYTFDLVRAHPIEWARVRNLTNEILWTPHRLILVVVTLVGVWNVARHRSDNVRRAFRFWVWFGGAGALPSLFAYMKVFGTNNNLAAIDLMLASLAVPCLLIAMSSTETKAASVAHHGAFALLFFLIATLWPSKRPPTDNEFDYMSEWEWRVAKDLRLGHKVLVAHGTSVLLRAGATEVPRDRANSTLELNTGALDRLADTAKRFEEGVYSRVYLTTPFYQPYLSDTIEQDYREVRRIDAPLPEYYAAPHREFFWGFSPELWTEVRILEPRAICPPEKPRTRIRWTQWDDFHE